MDKVKKMLLSKQLLALALTLTLLGLAAFSTAPKAQAGPATACEPSVGSFGVGMRIWVDIIDHNGNQVGYAQNYSFKVTTSETFGSNYLGVWPGGNFPGLGQHYAGYWGAPESRYTTQTYTVNDSNRSDCYGTAPFIFDSLVGTDLNFIDCLYNASLGLYGATFTFEGQSIPGVGPGHWVNAPNINPWDSNWGGADMNGQAYQTTIYYQLDPPPYTIQGYRIDHFGNAASQFGNGGSASTRVDGTGGGATNANPWFFTSLQAASGHSIWADDTADWMVKQWSRCYAPGCQGYELQNGNSVWFGAQFPGTVWDMRFYYEPRPSSVTAGAKVRDNPSGPAYTPCGTGKITDGLCGNVSMRTDRISGPAKPGDSGQEGAFQTGYNYSGGNSNTSAPNNQVGFGGLYYGVYRTTLNALPTGYRIAGWQGYPACGTNSYCDVDVGANQNPTVEVLLELSSINVRVLKKGPGTFINQNSAITTIGNGITSLNNQTRANGNAAVLSTTLSYNNSTYSLNAQAADGWQMRGYAFCIGNVNQGDCTNDGSTSGDGFTMINIDASGAPSLDLTVAFNGAGATINGRAVTAGQELFIAVFFKPKPIDVQVKAWINQQGGSSSGKINPCDQADYKKQICDDSRIRAVRMNTAGGINNNDNPGRDTGDPAGGAMNVSCTSTDYIPTKPGYNYTNFGNYYCALKDTGGTTGASGTGFISYGQTLDAASGGISANANPENNVAIFRNVYPGKYSFQADGTPHNGGTSGWSGTGCPTGGESCNDNPLVSTVAIGVSGFPELAYDVGQSTCNINTTNCQNDKTVIADSGGCKLDHRRKASHAFLAGVWYEDISLNGAHVPWWYTPRDDHGEEKCTIMNGGSAGDLYYTSPEPWNPSHNWNAAQPSRCLGNYENWWPPLGKGVYGETACGYYKNSTKSVYTYSMGILPGTGIGQNGKALREQNFIYSPKVKLTQGAITCDTYTAKLAFMPDPARPVDSYFRIAAPSLTNLVDSSNNPIIVSTPGGNGVDAHDVVLHIPKYNGPGANRLLKDGIPRGFEHFARFGSADPASGDPALVNGYSASAADWSTGGYKYTPTRVFTGNHACTNNATCDNTDFNDQLSQYSTIDVDDTSTINLEVNMTNTGDSYWMRNVNENGANNTTGHQLIVAGGTIRSTSHDNTRAWVIGDDEMLLPNGKHVYPINPVDDSGGSISGDNTVSFEITPEPPTDGGSKFVLGFQMAQNNVAFGTACVGELEIKVSYKPWLRVQNGNVTALGKIQDQSERSRGVYKSETSSNAPYRGSVEVNFPPTAASPNAAAKPALNLHTQFSVAAEMGGENFCSTNFYMLGIATEPLDLNDPQQNRNCDFGSMELNIDNTGPRDTDPNLKQLNNADIYNDVKQNIMGGGDEAYGQCVDTASNNPEDGDSGPYELSQAYKYYRSWWPGSASNAQDLVWDNSDGPTTFGGVSDPDGPFGKSGTAFNLTNTAPNGRPCPTVFQLTTSAAAGSNLNLPEKHSPLGGFSVASGRSTILSDDTVYITGNIITDLTGSYQFKRGSTASGSDAAPDTAGLNSLPNLGIIADGDIVIASNVTEIDASLYATGSIITCDKYALPGGMNEDLGKTDNSGTTGSKWIRHGSNATDANPLKNEIDDPNVVEPPTADNDTAKACSENLKITGSVTAGTSFKFGRNYIDFAGMVTKWGDAEANAFGLYGKFCNESTATPIANFQRACTVLGRRRDFDSPEEWGVNYLLAYKAGHPQNYYTGGPAEDFIGNGLASFIPPPGFEDLGGALQSAKYYNNSVKPQF